MLHPEVGDSTLFRAGCLVARVFRDDRTVMKVNGFALVLRLNFTVAAIITLSGLSLLLPRLPKALLPINA